MAWTSEYLSDDEWADYQANMPLIVARSSLYNPSGWRWSDHANFSDTDYSDPSFPPRLAHDHFAHARTKPAAHAGTDQWYFCCELDPTKSFDTVGLIGHNIPEIYGDDVYCAIAIADSPDFAGGSGFEYIASQIVPDLRRIVFPILNHGGPSGSGVYSRVYSGAAYLLVAITTGAGDFTGLPEIGELIVGRRRQLHSKPDVPWDDLGLETDATDFVSESGIVSRYVHAKGRSVISGNMTFANATRAAVLRQAYVDADHGTTPVLLVNNPAAEMGLEEGQQRALFGFLGEAMALPLTGGPYKRTGRLDFTESAPYFATEA